MRAPRPKPLSAEVWPEAYDRIVLETVDSTNAEAARIAGDLHRPTWIMAREQTAARGRRGRVWHQPEGNFAATLAMRPGGVPAWAALRSFMAANALFETLAMFVPREALGLKWPNDVLLRNRKVAGILLESAGSGGQVDWLAIGFGVNLAAAPAGDADADFAPIALAEVAERVPDAEEFLDILAGHYATEELVLHRLGFEQIRETWLERAARLGEMITARTRDGEVAGIFETIDAEGRLVLLTGTGEVRIAAADVFF